MVSVMVRSMVRSMVQAMLTVLCCGIAWVAVATAAETPAKPQENDFYRIDAVEIPNDAYLEVGALEWIPDGRLAVASRRGEIWMASDLVSGKPRWQRFAHGLHEVLGLAWRDGWLYVTQRPEVSRLRDTTGDGVADDYETVSDRWGVSGDYHEYAFGSKFDREGNLWIVLCLTGSFNSDVPFRGWAVRVTPDGRMVPTTSGVRSPGGIGFDADGNVLYTDNQGPWNGACSLKHLVPGDFVGHPGGFKWYALAPEMGEKPEEPKSGSRWATEVQRIPRLRPPAVVFPYDTMGKSAGGLACDATGGKFGSFAGQVFVTDQSHSIVMRCFLETIDGGMQGACFRFREGFKSGSLALQFAPDGSLYVGGTNRGWGSRGAGDYALERMTWTGKTPFEILAMRAVPGGFELEFTEPVAPQTAADLASYAAKGFTYIYQSSYGSPVVDEEPCPVEKAEPTADGRRVRLTLGNLREGVIHELKAAGVRSTAGLPLLHDTGWYTLNRLAK
jgi:glucose/arabinose dehydrogenase